MKIISKYKDFYDYIVQDYDADLYYVREPRYIHSNLKGEEEIVKKATKILKNKLDRHSFYNWQRVYRESKLREPGYIEIIELTFGIYPHIYTVPGLKVCNPDYRDTYIILTKNNVEYFCDPTISNDEAVARVIEFVSERCKNENFLKEPKYTCNYKTVGKAINDCIKQVEAPEIFQVLEAPIFGYCLPDAVYEGTVYSDAVYNACIYTTNICFNELNMNILKYFYEDLMNINVYINIENFLWSMKQEPVSVPDNKTKIISHGFDTKTSFRKM